jgi:uncharacterized damage-inducible protein DinB
VPIRRTLDVPVELVERFRQCGAATEYLIGVLPAGVWQAAPATRGKGRTIAAIVAHVQSVRRTFARMGGARPGPPSLDRRTVTPAQAQRAIAQSTETLAEQFAAAIAEGRTRVPGQPRRLADMLTYLMQHDAHHRGQITMLAHDLGHRLSSRDTTRIWGWSSLPPRGRG